MAWQSAISRIKLSKATQKLCLTLLKSYNPLVYKISVILIYNFLFTYQIAIAQDSIASKAQLFSAGFIDFMNSGQTTTGTKFLKVLVGEPTGVHIPLSLYCGVTNNTVQNSTTQQLKSNEHLVTMYINPMSGLLNAAFEDIIFRPTSTAKTRFGLSYQLGERLLNGVKIDTTKKPAVYTTINFLNTYAAAGLYFQTQAWERDKASKLGIFWLSARLHATRTGAKQLHSFLPALSSNGIYTGYSVGFGVQISKSVDVKAIYYKYLKEPEIEYLNSIYQFSLNYNTK
jgi:hypothetical protein